MNELDKNKKILDLITELRKLDETQLAIVEDCIQASLKVQYLLEIGKKEVVESE